VVKDIPIKCFNPDICNYVIDINPDLITSIPEDCRSRDLIQRTMLKLKLSNTTREDINPATLEILMKTPELFFESNTLCLLPNETIVTLLEQNAKFKYAHRLNFRRMHGRPYTEDF